MAEASQDQDNPLQGYFEWQVTTLLLAYDLADPLARGDDESAEKRRRAVEEEVSEVSLAAIPEQYKNDPEADWPPQIMMNLTRVTFERVREIAPDLTLSF